MSAPTTFAELQLKPELLSALAAVGYEQPSPIQAQSIPALLDGKDLIAQAQTGTGKTAAFALPILQSITIKHNAPQALILAPTRELAIQVAEALQSYAKFLNNFHVLPIYGGQDYSRQLKGLKRGPHVIVGTPGRIMDHLRRGSLCLDSINTFILDEADEMLRMGFIEDVTWILQQIKHQHQTALFSATLPSVIRKIAKQFLDNPIKIHIEPKVTTVNTIDQSYMLVAKKDKLAALTRYLEIEDINSAIIFTGTKTYSMEVAEKLTARGYAAAALNGDMSQNLREQVIQKLKQGKLDIIVATEVAARGLDVERISHVINFDMPQAVESYIHRIGRTGRAGRTGKSLLLVTSREKRMLSDIATAVNQQIKPISPPTAASIREQRQTKLKDEIMSLLSADLSDQYKFLESLYAQTDADEQAIAAALLHYINQQQTDIPQHDLATTEFERSGGNKRHSRSRRPQRQQQRRRQSQGKNDRNKPPRKRRRKSK